MPTPRHQSSDKQRSSSAKRMAEYRKRMRAAGYRQVQMWVRDTRRPEIADEIRRQCQAIAAHDPGGDEIMTELEAGGYDWPPYDWPQDK
jgi:hypothetical protein